MVLKAAQAVWAANKYFVLACSQQYYLKIRRELRPHNLQIEAAYNTLEDVSKRFGEMKTEQLPQLTNALYHVAGYFKGKLSNEERQQINHYIQTNPKVALERLEKYTFELQIDYLQISSLWQKHRTKPFDRVPVKLKHKNVYMQKINYFGKGIMCY